MQSKTYLKKKKKYIDYPEVFDDYQPPPKPPKTELKQFDDSEGLSKAYEQGDAVVMGQTLYVAGSHTARDWFDDVTKIPAWGDVRNSERYQRAEEILKKNPQVNRVIGHSLGGSVALELEKNYPQIKHSTTYGAPVLSLMPGSEKKADRYRHYLDPVSILDRNAKSSLKWNLDPINDFSLTHSFKNLGKQNVRYDLVERNREKYIPPPPPKVEPKQEVTYQAPPTTFTPQTEYEFDGEYTVLTE